MAQLINTSRYHQGMFYYLYFTVRICPGALAWFHRYTPISKLLDFYALNMLNLLYIISFNEAAKNFRSTVVAAPSQEFSRHMKWTLQITFYHHTNVSTGCSSPGGQERVLQEATTCFLLQVKIYWITAKSIHLHSVPATLIIQWQS